MFGSSKAPVDFARYYLAAVIFAISKQKLKEYCRISPVFAQHLLLCVCLWLQGTPGKVMWYSSLSLQHPLHLQAVYPPQGHLLHPSSDEETQIHGTLRMALSGPVSDPE